MAAAPSRYAEPPPLGAGDTVAVGGGRRPGKRGTARMEGLGPAELRREWQQAHASGLWSDEQLLERFGTGPHEFLLGGPSGDDPGHSVPLPGKFGPPLYVDDQWREYSRAEQGSGDAADGRVQLFVRLSNQRTSEARHGPSMAASELPELDETLLLYRNRAGPRDEPPLLLNDGGQLSTSPIVARVAQLDRGPRRRATARVWVEVLY